MSTTQVTRRELFLGAGMTAGAIAAVSAVGGLAYAPAAQAALSKSRNFFANNVLVELDGVQAGRALSAVGGEPVIVPVSNALGAEKTQTQTTLRYEPLSMILGDMSAAMYDWIGKATAGAASPHQVQVITSNLDGKEIYRLVAQNVRLTEVKLDDFDATSKEPLRFNVKMAPGLSTHQFGGKGVVTAPITQKAKQLLRSNFRLYIQGLENSTNRIRSVDPVGLVESTTGGLTPMPLKFAVPFNDAGPFFAWMQDTLQGKGGTRQAELQLLTADLKNVAASVAFGPLMITRISCPAENNKEVIQQAEIECMPASVTFNMGELLK